MTVLTHHPFRAPEMCTITGREYVGALSGEGRMPSLAGYGSGDQSGMESHSQAGR